MGVQQGQDQFLVSRVNGLTLHRPLSHTHATLITVEGFKGRTSHFVVKHLTALRFKACPEVSLAHRLFGHGGTAPFGIHESPRSNVRQLHVADLLNRVFAGGRDHQLPLAESTRQGIKFSRNEAGTGFVMGGKVRLQLVECVGIHAALNAHLVGHGLDGLGLRVVHGLQFE